MKVMWFVFVQRRTSSPQLLLRCKRLTTNIRDRTRLHTCACTRAHAHTLVRGNRAWGNLSRLVEMFGMMSWECSNLTILPLLWLNIRERRRVKRYIMSDQPVLVVYLVSCSCQEFFRSFIEKTSGHTKLVITRSSNYISTAEYKVHVHLQSCKTTPFNLAAFWMSSRLQPAAPTAFCLCRTSRPHGSWRIRNQLCF